MENTKKIITTTIFFILFLLSCKNNIKNTSLLNYDKDNNLQCKIYNIHCTSNGDTIYFSDIFLPKENKNIRLNKIIDVKSFEIIEPKYLPSTYYYFKDKKNIYIYYCDFLNKNPHDFFFVAGRASNYKKLGGTYLRVENKVYCRGKELKNVDTNSFKTFNVSVQYSEKTQTLGMDKNYIYVYDNKIKSINEFNDLFDKKFISDQKDSLEKVYFSHSE